MFRNLSDLTKAGVFYALAFCLVTAVALLSNRMGEGVLIISMFTPLAALLILFFVVTRDGFSREAWRSIA